MRALMVTGGSSVFGLGFDFARWWRPPWSLASFASRLYANLAR